MSGVRVMWKIIRPEERRRILQSLCVYNDEKHLGARDVPADRMWGLGLTLLGSGSTCRTHPEAGYHVNRIIMPEYKESSLASYVVMKSRHEAVSLIYHRAVVVVGELYASFRVIE